jgi:hypothetical protein
MTTIPPLDRTELAKCIVCDCDCNQLCTQCRKIFCVKHILAHLENCCVYKVIVQSILRDNLIQVEKHVVESFPRSIYNVKSPDESVRTGRNKMILVGRKQEVKHSE